VVERTVRQTGEVRNRLSGELSDVSAGELILGGPAVLTAAALGLAA
jgi:hypothetical protein